MGTNDYQYDEIGNLIEDQSEEIDAIEWTVYGKVKSVTRTSGSTKPNLEFTYDASGNRATKTVKNGLQADQWERTYYIRDAAGQLLATYSSKIDQNTTNGGTHVARFVLEDQQLYGSSRLGSKTINKELFTEEFTGTLGADFWDYSGTSAGHQVAPAPANRGQQVRGEVPYELTDHLGNVRSVITDRKLPTQNGGIVDYAPDVVSAQDYYPFGSLMPGRKYANISFSNDDYRYAFNGMERDDQLKGVGNSYDFGARIYDTRLGKWLSIDPLFQNYPMVGSYVGIGNNPVLLVDPDGRYLRLSFENQKAYKAYLKMVKTSLDGQFKVVLRPVGDRLHYDFQVKLVATDGGGDLTKLSERGLAFYEEYVKVLDDPHVVRQEVVYNKKDVQANAQDRDVTFIGSFALNTIDMYDIEKLDAAGDGGFSSAGAFIHETVEQLEKAKLGLEPGEMGRMEIRNGRIYPVQLLPCHEEGKKAEDKVNGNRQIGENKVTVDPDGTVTKHIITPNPDGKTYDIKKEKQDAPSNATNE